MTPTLACLSLAQGSASAPSVRRCLVLLCLAAATLASGCGFALRQVPHFAFESLRVLAPDKSVMGNALKRSIGSNGNVQLVTDARNMDSAQVILEVLGDQREKSVTGMNAAGQVLEFQLRLRVKFRLRTPAGKELIPETEIMQQRDISFSESAALAKEAEEALLYRDMQSDIVQQVLRRLAAVRTL